MTLRNQDSLTEIQWAKIRRGLEPAPLELFQDDRNKDYLIGLRKYIAKDQGMKKPSIACIKEAIRLWANTDQIHQLAKGFNRAATTNQT